MPVRFLLILVVCTAVSRAQSPSRDAAVGVWPWLVGNIDAQVPSILQQVQNAGLDTVYLHVYRTTGPSQGLLQIFDEAGTFPASLGSVAPLATLSYFISEAHDRNIQVVAVVNCFLDGAPLPGDPAHENVLLGVIDHLVNTYTGSGAQRYALDGIALDRVRFYAGTGNPAPVVTDFVRRAKEVCGSIPLHAFLMANLYHIDGPPYDGSFRTYSQAMGLLSGQFGQDWEALSPILDVSLPMAYIADGGLYGNVSATMQAYLNVVAQYAQQARVASGDPDLRILPAVRAWNDSTGTTSVSSLDACIGGAHLGGADGTMVFRYFTALGQTSWWNVIQSHAVPGSDLPVARTLASSAGGLSVMVDAGISTAATATGPLAYAFDLDEDGTLDRSWSADPTFPVLLPQSGTQRIVGVRVRDALGRVAGRKHRISASAPSLSGSGFVSAAAGGIFTLTLNTGLGGAGHGYVLAATASGMAPGTPLGGGIVLPLNVDSVTDVFLDLLGSPLVPGFAGVASGSGVGVGQLLMPAGFLPPTLAWTTLHFAGVTVAPGSTEFSHGTNAVSLLFFP